MQTPPSFEPDTPSAGGKAPPSFEPDAPTGAATAPQQRRRFGARMRLPEPGDSPDNAIDQAHPDLTWTDRTKAMNLSANPEVAARYLQEKGFEAVPIEGYDISIRKPGGKWMKLDPSALEFSDITDIGSDIVSAGAQTAAAVPAAIWGSTVGTPLLGATAGTAAAGLAGAGVEAGKEAIAKLAGMPVTGWEAASAIGREGAIGAISYPVGAGIAKGVGLAGKGIAKAGGYTAEKVGPWLQRPLKKEIETGKYGELVRDWKGSVADVAAEREVAKDLSGRTRTLEGRKLGVREAILRGSRPIREAKQAEQGLTADVLEAQQKIAPEREAFEALKAGEKEAVEKVLGKKLEQAPGLSKAAAGRAEAEIEEGLERGAIAGEELAEQATRAPVTKARADILENQIQRQAALREAASMSDDELENIIKQGQEHAFKAKITRTEAVTSKIPHFAEGPLFYDVEVAHPVWSFRADYLLETPQGNHIARLMQKHLGPEIFNTLGEELQGSASMASRRAFINNLVRKPGIGKAGVESRLRSFEKDLAAYYRGHPELGKTLNEGEQHALDRIVGGTPELGDSAALKRITQKTVTEYATKMRKWSPLRTTEREATLEQMRAKQAVQETGEALAEKQAATAAKTEEKFTKEAARQERFPLEQEQAEARLKRMGKERELGPTGPIGEQVAKPKGALAAQKAQTARLKAMPYIQKAQRLADRIEEALLKSRKAEKAHKSPGGGLFKTERREMIARTKKLRQAHEVSKVDPKFDPYAQFPASWLGGGGRGVIRTVLDVAGRPLNQGFVRVLDKIGKGLEKAPAKLRPVFQGIKNQAEKHGEKAALATVALYARSDPEFQRWLASVLP